MSQSIAVDIADVTKDYGDRRALDHVSLQVGSCSRTVVLGHNGAGKSTLLEIIATLRVPTTGTVVVGGYDSVREAKDARRLIGLTPQSNALDPLATMSEVLRFQGAALGLGRRASVRRSDALSSSAGSRSIGGRGWRSCPAALAGRPTWLSRSWRSHLS